MEIRINKRVADFICEFKDNIAKEAQVVLSKNNVNPTEINNLIGKIYNYDILQFEKEEFEKRKRVKNVVPIFERCCAKRANDEQCTRRKKKDSLFCGTHSKGTPHGHMSETMNTTSDVSVMEIRVVEIKGIAFYIDSIENVYSHEDIMSNKENPRIIAKYIKTDAGEYEIVE